MQPTHRPRPGRGAVERQNPSGKARLEPPVHGGLQDVSPSACRQNRYAVEQFRLIHRRQIQLPCIVLGWFEKNAAETRMKDPKTGDMVRAGGQKTMVATLSQ